MEIGTAITLLTINLIVLSVVIILVIVATIILVVKLGKIASNVQQTTNNVARITEWFSPVRVFGELAKLFTSKKR